jgi:hypothetical protein
MAAKHEKCGARQLEQFFWGRTAHCSAYTTSAVLHSWKPNELQSQGLPWSGLIYPSFQAILGFSRHAFTAYTSSSCVKQPHYHPGHCQVDNRAWYSLCKSRAAKHHLLALNMLSVHLAHDSFMVHLRTILTRLATSGRGLPLLLWPRL